jgi:hypothetical protein
MGRFESLHSPLTAAVLIVLLVCVRDVKADEGATLAEIHKAWQQRQAAAETLHAEFQVERMSKSLAELRKPDPEPRPRIDRLDLHGPNFRVDYTIRSLQTEGWRTANLSNVYNPEDGWELLLAADEGRARPSLTRGRPPGRFSDLQSYGLLLFWFRPLDENFTQVPFEAWQICTETALVDPREGITTIQAQVSSGIYAVLFLDDALGYLPIGSRTGPLSPGASLMATHSQSRVVVSPESTATHPVPKSWQTETPKEAGKVFVQEICQLITMSHKPPSEPVSFRIDRPDNVYVSETDSRPVSRFGKQVSAQPMNTPERPMPIAYWCAIFFGGLLFVSLYFNWRANSKAMK